MVLVKTNKNGLIKEKIPYIFIWIMYYAWVIVFTTWWTSSPVTDKLMGPDSRVMLHSLNLLSSAFFICIIKPKWYKNASYIGACLVLLFSVLSMIDINNSFHIFSIIVLSISLGIVNISILIPMIYILNNTEKLISIIGANLLISFLVLLQELKILTINNGLIFSFVMLLISLFPILFFKKDDLKKENIDLNFNKNKINKIMLLTIILNCVYAILCKGIGRAFVIMAIENISINLYPIYYVGAILGCLISYIVYKTNKTSTSTYVSWNLIFGLFATSMFIYSVANYIILNEVFSFLMGIVSSMGMINMYYTLGIIGKKYSSHLYVKISIIFIGLLGGISGTIFGNSISHINKLETSITLSIISVLIIIIFLVISPSISKIYYNDKIDAKERKNNIIRNSAKKYKLSSREEELCKILIEGYTLRQASAMMGIRYYTANSYCKNIYKKLNINSKIELINKFKQ